jgi:hypothetical protein
VSDPLWKFNRWVVFTVPEGRTAYKLVKRPSGAYESQPDGKRSYIIGFAEGAPQWGTDLAAAIRFHHSEALALARKYDPVGNPGGPISNRVGWERVQELPPDFPPELAEDRTCPDCGSSVTRQKCFFELGGDCPRHEVAADWERDIRRWERERVENLAGAGI